MTISINSVQDEILAEILYKISGTPEELHKNYSNTSQVSKKWLRITRMVQARKINNGESRFQDFPFDTYEKVIKFLDLAGKQIRVLNIHHLEGLDAGKVLTLMSKCQNLYRLSLQSDGLTEDAVGEIVKHKNLKSSALICSEDFSCESLNQLDHLDSLDLSFSEIKQPPSALKTIKKLNLKYCPSLTDDSMEKVGQMVTLEELALAKSEKITKKGFSCIGNLTNLRILSLISFKNLTDDGFNALLKSEKLTSLNLSFCRNLTSKSLEVIASRCGNLKRLVLDGCDQMFKGEEVKWANLSELRKLSLKDCFSITNDRLIRIVEPLTQLEDLDLDNLFRITDEVVPTLKALPKLRKISTDDTGITKLPLNLE